jgi:hypothetical protein
MDNATTQNAFVPRLWASRRIAMLVDAVRQLGADGGGTTLRQTGRDEQRNRFHRAAGER